MMISKVKNQKEQKAAEKALVESLFYVLGLQNLILVNTR